MARCINRCADPADQNISWPTSRGPMSVNLCGVCSAAWWNQFKNTPAGQSAIIGDPKSMSELQAVCDEYNHAGEA